MTYSEEKYWQHPIALFLLLAIILVSGNTACKRAQRFEGYEGSWWRDTPLDQQFGFIDGFVDSYTYGLREREQLVKPRIWLQKAISEYYERHGEDESMLVGQVLIRVAESPEASSATGEESSSAAQQNKVFDGRVWLNYSNKERLGFVEGCLNALMPQSSRAVSFPRNPQYYVDEITRRFSVSEIDPLSASVPNDVRTRRIADILWEMRNRSKENADRVVPKI